MEQKNKQINKQLSKWFIYFLSPRFDIRFLINSTAVWSIGLTARRQHIVLVNTRTSRVDSCRTNRAIKC